MLDKTTAARLTLALAALATAMTAIAYDITGRVADTDGQGLPGASVRLLARRDSSLVKAVAADDKGLFNLRDVRDGRYIVEASYVGCSPQYADVRMAGANVRLKPLTLAETAATLAEATVTGIRTPIKVMQDTVEFNADTYKTQPNAVVEDLLKRLPGVEVGSDGKITSNGKEVTKILVDGKEFFGDDPKVASKNLPVNMVDKLQVVDRKSDLARITGVDDGEEETVINLTVKKGMKNGWFGNAVAGYGTDARYKGSFTVNRFWNDNQVTLLGGLNSINEPGFTDGAAGRFRRFGGDNGITLSQALGLNFNVGNAEILRVGGNLMYSHTNVRTVTRQLRQYLFEDSTSYMSADRRARDRGHNVRADLRLQWNPDRNNTFELRPRMSYNVNDSWSLDSSLTQSGLRLPVTKSINRGLSDGKSYEFGAEAIYNHKFARRKGRSFSIQARWQSSNVRENEDTWSWNRFFMVNDSLDLYDQTADNHTWNNTASARISWTEPLGNPEKGHFVTVAYNIRYRWNNADKMVYDNPDPMPLYDGWLGDVITAAAQDRDLVRRDDLSNRFRNDYMNQDIRAGYKHVDKNGTLDAGLSLVPQMSRSIDLIDSRRNMTRHVLNLAPYLRWRLKMGKSRSLNLNYRGRSSQPSLSQLQPVADYSDPLRVVVGNPGLDPTFTHSVQLRFQDFNAGAQRSVMAMLNGSVVQNSIVSLTRFNALTGGQTTTYANVNGVFNLMAMGMYSSPLRNRDFVANAHAFARYAHNVGFNNGRRNTAQSFSVNLMPSLAWRPKNIELEVRPRYSVQLTANSVQQNANRTVHTYGGMFNGTYTAPFGLVLSADLNYAATSGYSAGYDSRQCLLNATISYQTLRDRSLTFSLTGYDLLQQKSNIRRTETANYIDDTMYNSLTRYFMASVSYRFNTFGKGNQPRDRNERRGPMGPPPGGRRPF